jgi:hypothetical protein
MKLRRFLLILLLALMIVVLYCCVARPRSVSHADRAANPLDVAVSEVAWTGTTVSSSDEWIELYNNIGSTVGLTGWMFSAAENCGFGNSDLCHPGLRLNWRAFRRL